MEHILALYARPYNPAYPVVCFDEKCLQLLADSRCGLPIRPGQLRRQDYEYRRIGTRNLCVVVEPLAARRYIRLTKRPTKADFAHMLRYLVDVLYPDARCIELVLDNLNTHTFQAVLDTFGIVEANRIMRRICFHRTPLHASWLNMAEIEISVLSRQCLRQRFATDGLLRAALNAYQPARNAAAAKIHWSFSVDKARHVFARYYPEPSLC
jgi:DDE superfamily endonuclease